MEILLKAGVILVFARWPVPGWALLAAGSPSRGWMAALSRIMGCSSRRT